MKAITKVPKLSWSEGLWGINIYKKTLQREIGFSISRFQDNSFINEYHTPKFVSLLVFIFLSPLVHQVWVWALFKTSFGLMTEPCWIKTTNFWEIGFINEYFSQLKAPFTFDFCLSIKIGTWNTNLELFDPFWVDNVPNRN